MSSLIFYTDENQALIATDTLATSDKIPGAPFKFTTKAFVIPHLRMIIAGTGCGGFCDRWFLQINDRMIVKDIENLNYHTPRNLALLWSSYKKELPILEDATTTIYHFGFSEKNQSICSFAYRSTNNFKSEQLPYGLGGKPEYIAPTPYELPKDFKTIMDSQIIIQSSESKQNRVYIGGEIQLIRLERGGFIVQSLGKFEGYDSVEDAIYRNFNQV